MLSSAEGCSRKSEYQLMEKFSSKHVTPSTDVTSTTRLITT